MSMTELEAVNQILRDALGETPVSALGTGLPEAEDALVVLREVSKREQAKGWHCNRDEDYTLARDVNNKIPLPVNVLRVDSYGTDADLDVTVRYDSGSPFLYDKDDKTFVFAKNIKTEIVWEFDFEELTYELQQYITMVTSIEVQKSDQGSVVADKLLQKKYDEAWAALMDAEAESEDDNVLVDSPHCRSISYRNSVLYGT